MQEKVFIKKLHPAAKVPHKKHDTDACYDCHATYMKDHGNGIIEYGLGFSLQPVNPMTKVTLKPRSSIYKTGLMLSNCVGVGDEGYTGEYRAFFYNIIPDLPNYEVGDRILQIEIEGRRDIEFVQVEGLTPSDRGNGGFGSTGLR